MNDRVAMAKAELARREAARAELTRRQQQSSDQRKQDIMRTVGADTSPGRDLLNFGGGLGKATQNILATVPETFGYQMPRINFDRQNPTTRDQIFSGAGQMAPLAAAIAATGGTAAIPLTAAYGYTQVEPGQQGAIDRVLQLEPDTGFKGRSRNAIEDALLGMGLGQVAKGIGKTKLGQSIGNEITRLFTGKINPSSANGNVLEGELLPPEAPNLGVGGGATNYDKNVPYRRPSVTPEPEGEARAPSKPNARFGYVPEEFLAEQYRAPDFLQPAENKPFPQIGMQRPGAPQLQQVPEIPEMQPSQLQEPVAPQLPEAPKAIPQESPQTLNAVKAHIGGGQDLTESRKTLAGLVRNKFSEVSAEGKKLYNKIFKAPEFVNKQGVANEYPELFVDDEARDALLNSGDELSMKLAEKPTLENAQEAKTMMAADIRKLERKSATREPLNSEERAQLKRLRRDHTHLETKMNEIIGNDAPHLENALTEANNYWRDNVAKYYFDKRLRGVATGADKNPETFKSIFAYPNEDALAVANDLGEAGKRHIINQALNKTPQEFGHETVAGMRSSLDKSGHKEYITPQLESHLTNYEQQTGREAANAAEIAQHGETVKQMQGQHKANMAAYNKATTKEQRDHTRLVKRLTNEVKGINARNEAARAEHKAATEAFDTNETLKANLLKELETGTITAKKRVGRNIAGEQRELGKAASEDQAIIDKELKVNNQLEMYRKAVKKYEANVEKEKASAAQQQQKDLLTTAVAAAVLTHGGSLAKKYAIGKLAIQAGKLLKGK